MEIKHLQSLDIDNAAGSTVVIPCLPDGDIKALLSDLTPALTPSAGRIAEDFAASKEELFALFFGDVRLELVRVKTATFSGMLKAMHSFTARNGRSFTPDIHLSLGHITEDLETLAEAAVNGFLLGTYQPGLFKSEHASSPTPQLFVYCDASAGAAIARGQHTAATQQQILRLVNTPSNHKSPQTLADWAVGSGQKHGYQVTVLTEETLREQGFDALLAVNRGSEYPARFIICDYQPAVDAATHVGLVGKGVTFDTGGLSIKPSNNMHYMKSDMGGAAAVLGAVELAAKLALPVRITGFVPTTDNSVDARAIKPGDVIGSYSGQTIEVINTDAEGRLILADALSYAIRNYQPDVLVDLATLTGSVVRALGTHCAGLFTHSDDLADGLIRAGDRVAERLWRMPLWEDYAEDMRSDIADIKNLGDKPMAGSITAAKFLEHFIEAHPAWAHLDIAGTAFKANGVSRNHTATAFGVRLLVEWMRSLVSTPAQSG